jgi:hypothetical protein
VEHQEVWEGPSWSSTALRYDVAFFWSINPFYYSLSLDGTDKQLGQLSSSGTASVRSSTEAGLHCASEAHHNTRACFHTCMTTAIRTATMLQDHRHYVAN